MNSPELLTRKLHCKCFALAEDIEICLGNIRDQVSKVIHSHYMTGYQFARGFYRSAYHFFESRDRLAKGRYRNAACQFGGRRSKYFFFRKRSSDGVDGID